MYVFCSALNIALHNKILQLSLMPTILEGLVEKAQEFNRNWHTFAGPTRGFQCSGKNAHIQEISGEESEINTTMQHCNIFGHGRGHGHGHGRLTLQQREHCIKNNLCLYCGKPGHHVIDCTELPNYRPGNSCFSNQQSGLLVWQINTIPEEGMEKLSLEDKSRVNIASANYFEPLVKINIDD